MAKAKKATITAKTKSKGFLFKSKSGTESSTLEKAGECKAQQVMMEVLEAGRIPDGLNLRFAKSYGAHYIQRKGKNAVGYFDTKDTLVINGIADELEASGVKGIIAPSKTKNYKAIRLSDLGPKELKTLVSKIVRVLGFTKSEASSTAQPVETVSAKA